MMQLQSDLVSSLENMSTYPDVSLQAKDQYFREVRQLVKMTAEEQATCLRRIARGKAEQLKDRPNQWAVNLAQYARDRLVEGYQPLVIKLASRAVSFFKRMELLDLVQEGNLGLLRAIDGYLKADSAFSFYSFAVTDIRYAILNALWSSDGSIQFRAGKASTLVRQFDQVHWALRLRLERSPSLAEIAQEMDISVEKACEVMQWCTFRSMDSLQGVFEEKEYDDDRTNLVSLFAPAAQSDSQQREVMARELQRALDAVLPELPRQVVKLRFGLGEERDDLPTCREVAQELDITERAVRYWERWALERLKQVLEVAPERNQSTCIFNEQLGQALPRKRFEYCTSDYYTLVEAAQRLKVSTRTVQRWATMGHLASAILKGTRSQVYLKWAVDALAELSA